jgi:protein-disulfide isomerase
MARRRGSGRNAQERSDRAPSPWGGGNALRLAIVVGVVAMAGVVLAHQWQLRRLEERWDARLRHVEARLEPASATQPLAFSESSTPLELEPDAPPASVRNPTVSALSGVIPVGSRQPDADRIYDFDLSAAPGKGPEGAPISIVEFSDFQCSFCRKAQPILARIQEVYGGQVRWVWKHLPISIHEDAPMAHLASVAADRQGRFWEFQQKLFLNSDKLKLDDLRQHAFEVGLDMQQFEQDLYDPGSQQVVEADMAEAVAIDLTATPGFFVNGRYIRGARPFEVFAEIINDELIRHGLPIPEAARIEPES